MAGGGGPGGCVCRAAGQTSTTLARLLPRLTPASCELRGGFRCESPFSMPRWLPTRVWSKIRSTVQSARAPPQNASWLAASAAHSRATRAPGMRRRVATRPSVCPSAPPPTAHAAHTTRGLASDQPRAAPLFPARCRLARPTPTSSVPTPTHRQHHPREQRRCLWWRCPRACAPCRAGLRRRCTCKCNGHAAHRQHNDERSGAKVPGCERTHARQSRRRRRRVLTGPASSNVPRHTASLQPRRCRRRLPGEA